MNIKDKNLYAIIFIIVISLLSSTSDVIASKIYYYEFGFEINDELIWNCHVCDNNKMNDLFGENWNRVGLFENLSQGKRMKWHINGNGWRQNSSINSTILYANVDIWMWSNEENWGSYDYNVEFTHLDDVSQYPTEYTLLNVIPFVPFWFPVPISEYIGSLKLSSMYDIDNRVLPTLNVEINKDFLQPDYPSERILIIAFYNTDGILSTFKLYSSGNVVVIDIEFESLPIYVLPATLGLIGLFFIAIILYVKKQRNNESINRSK